MDDSIQKINLFDGSGRGEAAKPTLLVVDDEEGPRQSLKVVFQKEYEVILASTSEEAMALAKVRSIDAAVLDLRMGNTSGMELLQLLKEINPLIEVILLTAYGSEETICQALRFGACDFITKPFNLREMRDAVSKAIQRHTLNEHIQERQDRLQVLEKQLLNRSALDPVPKWLGEEARSRGLFFAQGALTHLALRPGATVGAPIGPSLVEVDRSLQALFEPLLTPQGDWLPNLCRWTHALITCFLAPMQQGLHPGNRNYHLVSKVSRYRMLLWHFWFALWLKDYFLPGGALEWDWIEVNQNSDALERHYLEGPKSQLIQSRSFNHRLPRLEIVWRIHPVREGLVQDWIGMKGDPDCENSHHFMAAYLFDLNESLESAMYITHREEFPTEIRLFVPLEKSGEGGDS